MAGSLTPAAQILLDMIVNARNDHHHLLGLHIEDHRPGWAKVFLPYGEHIVGNPDTGSLHGGVITTLLDTTMGFSVATSVNELTICPTLDLRIDYMSASAPGEPVFAEAEVYRSTRHVVFVRGKAYQNDSERPIAWATATFARLGSDSAASVQRYAERQETPI